MQVKFLRDVFNAGTKIYETGKQYEGDLARYVRRGDAVEVKGGAKPAMPEPAVEEKGKGRGGRGK